MTKKLKLWVIIAFVAIVVLSCSTTRKESKISDTKPLPPLSELYAIHDSIIKEAWHLYYSERVNWIATDLLLEKFNYDEIGSTLSWQPNDSIIAALFFDKTIENCLFEFRFNLISGQDEALYSVRPITDVELSVMQQHDKILKLTLDKYGDRLIFADQSFGSPNIDFITINNKLTRIYFLQGTVLPNVIPFGYDYSVDIDENLKPIAFRKYHNSLIPIKTKTDDGQSVRKIIHSHLKDNPYITATDICNFLLYGSEDLDSFSVYSTAYGCYFAYMLKLNQIITITD